MTFPRFSAAPPPAFLKARPTSEGARMTAALVCSSGKDFAHRNGGCVTGFLMSSGAAWRVIELGDKGRHGAGGVRREPLRGRRVAEARVKTPRALTHFRDTAFPAVSARQAGQIILFNRSPVLTFSASVLMRFSRPSNHSCSSISSSSERALASSNSCSISWKFLSVMSLSFL